MTLFFALLILFAGMAIGYRLPALRARWRAYLRARAFKPTLLRPYRPDSGRKEGGE